MTISRHRWRRPYKVRFRDRLICLAAAVVVVLLWLKASVGADTLPVWWKGNLEFCVRVPAECAPYEGGQSRMVHLTDAKFRELDALNREVNRQFDYISDEDHWGVAERWDYLTTTGKGDCEDFVLEKRRRLIELGWPRRALLMTVVSVPEGGELHAVLTVHTDLGDKILDLESQNRAVVDMTATPYRYLWRQSQRDPTFYDACDKEGRSC